MENFFATNFEDARHETLVKLLLSLPDAAILKQSKVTDHGINIIKNLMKLYNC